MSDSGWGEYLADVAQVALQIAATVAINRAMASLSDNTGKSQESNRSNLRQARPLRRRAVGTRLRAAGAFALRQEIGTVYAMVIAWPEGPGPVASFDRNWLNEDEVLVNGLGYVVELAGKRYETGRAKTQDRFGAQMQDAYGHLGDFGWSAQHWGRGVPSTALILEHGKAVDAAKQFPALANTEMTRTPAYTAYDWRRDSTVGGVGPQRRFARGASPEEIDAAQATWEPSENAAVLYVNTEWLIHGLDWDVFAAPRLAELTAAADLCDQLVPQRVGGSQVTGTANKTSPAITLDSVDGLAAGSEIAVAGMTLEVTSIVGDVVYVTPDLPADAPFKAPVRWINATEVLAPRYRVGMWWESDRPKKQVRQDLCAAMDAFVTFDGGGALVLRPGAWREPTVIFGDAEIISIGFEDGPRDTGAGNLYRLAYEDPLAGYAKVDSGTLADADLVARDGREKPVDFSPEGVHDNNQLCRLAKAHYGRANAPRIPFRTKMTGTRGLTENLIRLRSSARPELADIVVEIDPDQPPTIDFRTKSIVWLGILVTSARWDFNAETEETDGPVSGYSASPQVLDAPEIDTVMVFEALLAEGVVGLRLRIVATGPDRGDLTWFYRWRLDGAVSWTERPGGDIDPDADVVMETGESVPADATLNVEVAYQPGGGGRSGWSTTANIVTSTDNIAPASPSDGAATSPGPGLINVAWRNPSSSNFDHARIWRGGAADAFGVAVSQGTLAGAAGADGSFDQTGVTAGTYRLWITAENAAGTASTPIGPFTVTVA